MAFQPTTISMFQHDEANGSNCNSSNSGANQTLEAHWQSVANGSHALALAAATGASSSSSSSSPSSLSPCSPRPSSGSSNSAAAASTAANLQNQQQQAEALAEAANITATQERLASALLLHQHQIHQHKLQHHLQQQQQQQQQRLIAHHQRATSSASSAGSLEDEEDELSVRRLQLFRDFEAMAHERKQQMNSMDGDSSDSSLNQDSMRAEDRQFNPDEDDDDQQETALNLSVSKKREPGAASSHEPNEDLKNSLLLAQNERQQSLHAQLERQQREFQQASNRLYEHILACQMQKGTKQPGAGLLIAASRSPSDSLTSNSATSPSALVPNFAFLMQQNQLQHHQAPNNYANLSERRHNNHLHHHHQSSTTSSSHDSHSSSSASSSSSSSFSSSGASVPESPTGHSPASERQHHHHHHLAASTSGSSSASGSTCGGSTTRPTDQLTPASAAAAAQRLQQHLLNFNSERANALFVNQHHQNPQNQQQHHQSERSLQSRHNRELFFSHNHNQPHNNLMNVHHSHHLNQQQLLDGNYPLLQHELGPVHKADADDLDRIRNFIEQFKARRGALGLTQKQAAQCFRAYTNDRYAFSDNFVGHFEGFQFRPQTAMTIADSLAEWLEFAEAETRQGRQLSFMPGKVKETRKRKYEVIRIRDSAKRVLVEAFERNRSPSTSELEQLSKRTNIPSRNIEIFFKNRRTSRQYHH